MPGMPTRVVPAGTRYLSDGGSIESAPVVLTGPDPAGDVELRNDLEVVVIAERGSDALPIADYAEILGVPATDDLMAIGEAASLARMYDGFQIDDRLVVTVNDALRPLGPEGEDMSNDASLGSRLTSAPRRRAPTNTMVVTLGHAANPDYYDRGGYSSGGAPGSGQIRLVRVNSIREAVQVCREFIQSNDLGGGNWPPTCGRVILDGKDIAKISYNGRVWKPGPYPQPELDPDTGEEIPSERSASRTSADGRHWRIFFGNGQVHDVASRREGERLLADPSFNAGSAASLAWQDSETGDWVDVRKNKVLLGAESGYRSCACRDCMEIAIGEDGAMCHECESAGCDGDVECQAPGAYGVGEAESGSRVAARPSERDRGAREELDEHGDVLGDRDPDTLTKQDLADAERVAEEHLEEDPRYYTHLKERMGRSRPRTSVDGLLARLAQVDEPRERRRCTLCECDAVTDRYGFPVCVYHRDHGEDDPPCPKCRAGQWQRDYRYIEDIGPSHGPVDLPRAWMVLSDTPGMAPRDPANTSRARHQVYVYPDVAQNGYVGVRPVSHGPNEKPSTFVPLGDLENEDGSDFEMPFDAGSMAPILDRFTRTSQARRIRTAQSEPPWMWTKVGAEFVGAPDQPQLTHELILRGYAGMQWEPLGSEMSFAGGAALNETVRQLRIPNPVAGAESHDAAPYGLLGLRANYKNGAAEILLLDAGTETIPVAHRLFAGERWSEDGTTKAQAGGAAAPTASRSSEHASSSVDGLLARLAQAEPGDDMGDPPFFPDDPGFRWQLSKDPNNSGWRIGPFYRASQEKAATALREAVVEAGLASAEVAAHAIVPAADDPGGWEPNALAIIYHESGLADPYSYHGRYAESAMDKWNRMLEAASARVGYPMVWQSYSAGVSYVVPDVPDTDEMRAGWQINRKSQAARRHGAADSVFRSHTPSMEHASEW